MINLSIQHDTGQQGKCRRKDFCCCPRSQIEEKMLPGAERNFNTIQKKPCFE